MVVNQTGTRRALVQLLLLALPLLLTLQALVELPAHTESSHQLARCEKYSGSPVCTYFLLIIFVLSFQFFSFPSSFSIKFRSGSNRFQSTGRVVAR